MSQYQLKKSTLGFQTAFLTKYLIPYIKPQYRQNKPFDQQNNWRI